MTERTWVVVTGASRGIGKAIAGRLIEAGHGVVGIARDRRRLDAVREEFSRAHGARVFEPAPLDLADPDAVDAFWSRAGEGRTLAGLVNNAALAPYGPAEELPASEVTALLDVNVRSVYQCCVGAFRIFREQESGGAIVNIASIEAHLGTRLMAAYCASKFAVRGLTQALAVEWARHRVRVNSVSPGPVTTDMTAHLAPGTKGHEHLVRRTPMRRFAEPGEVAGAVAYLIGPESSFVTGTDIAVDGGFTA
ncbi:MAG TPA: SDR family oxidoreductase [Spirillospora sp.]